MNNWKIAHRLVSRTRVDSSGCIVWTGARNHRGYGYSRIPAGMDFPGPRIWRVHRLAFWLFRGPFNLDLTIDHRCHNRLCCNPMHLSAETLSDNATAANVYRWHGTDEEYWRELDEGF